MSMAREEEEPLAALALLAQAAMEEEVMAEFPYPVWALPLPPANRAEAVAEAERPPTEVLPRPERLAVTALLSFLTLSNKEFR